jgi:ribosomal protein L29
MKKEKMNKEETESSLQDQKLELIRLRIQNGFYENNHVIENLQVLTIINPHHKSPQTYFLLDF